MTHVSLLGRIVVINAALLGLAALSIVGRPRLRELRRTAIPRLRGAAPYVTLLGALLVVNSLLREIGPELSWLLRMNVTGDIYQLEGTFVVWVQSFATPELTAFFSFVYVYGYVFLLVFPLLAYLALPEQRHLRETCVAFACNYGIGLVLYILFISYGPRNMMPELVESLMYTNWPESQLLTSEVNTNTNVFPSLHTSLSVTVVLLAYRTRRAYPGWLILSTGLAGAVVASTMYLGIHWGIDVLAGMGLAVLSVVIATRFDPVAALAARADERVADRVTAVWRRLQDVR